MKICAHKNKHVKVAVVFSAGLSKAECLVYGISILETGAGRFVALLLVCPHFMVLRFPVLPVGPMQSFGL